MSSRATEAGLLQQRIAENAASQEVDFGAWVFAHVRVQPGDHVLELCCGTGNQTLPFLERVGSRGRVVAVDLSKAALDTLASKAQDSGGSRISLVQSSIDDLSSALKKASVAERSFDLVFCAYGLYYSTDAERVLDECRWWLKDTGRIVVVGPFGPNNQRLFDLVRASGVELSQPVIFSSERFMTHLVLPWGTRNFASVAVHTMVNPVRWATPEQVLNYWQNTTFYDASRRDAFEELLRAHFTDNGMFVNEKWVMLAEMSHGR